MHMKAERFMQQDPVLHTDMMQILRRGTGEILYDGEDGLFLRETQSGVLLLTAQPERGRQLLTALGKPPDCIVVHQAELEQYVRSLGLTGENPCWQAAYLSQEPLPLQGILEIRPPEEADYPLVRRTYHLSSDRELLHAFHGENFFGGYDNGKLAGFIGVHDDGSMGMLEILPAYRRRGYGAELASYLINHRLSQGFTPYGQIIYTNEKSMALNRKLGLSFSQSLLYWMWQED